MELISLIFFSTVARLKGRGLWSRQSSSTQLHFCTCPKWGISGFCMYCFVFAFSLLLCWRSVTRQIFRCICVLFQCFCFGASMPGGLHVDHWRPMAGLDLTSRGLYIHFCNYFQSQQGKIVYFHFTLWSIWTFIF